MKFLEFRVEDPLDLGRIDYPYFHAVLDERLDPWRESTYSDFKLKKAGAFFNFGEMKYAELIETVGEFNILPPEERSPRLGVVFTEEPEQREWVSIHSHTVTPYGMDINRIRQLMRKFELTDKWSLALDEQYATDTGLILWRPQRTQKVCGFWNEEKKARCTLLGFQTYTVKGVPVVFCGGHARLHDRVEMNRRKSA